MKDQHVPFLLLGLILAAGCGSSAPQAGGPTAPKVAPTPGEVQGFQEYPIGEEKELEGLRIAAVYFQPVPMEPAGMSLSPEKADIHLEADIAAAEGNQTGFGIGEWIPYLTVKYRLRKDGATETLEGSFMPMNASDGPHYGANVKLPGAGNYDLTFLIETPEKQGFLLHTDAETGVPGRFWKRALEVTWKFPYLPRQW